jgi:hypothetical protein
VTNDDGEEQFEQNYALRTLKQGDEHPFDCRGKDPTPPTDWAHRAARGVMADLSGRHGIKQELCELEPETDQELVRTLARIIRAAAEQK